MKRLIASRESLLTIALLALILLVSIRYPTFASPKNLAQSFNDTSILIILTLAQMAVILTRAIDLSTAANVCFTGMAVAMLNAAAPELPMAVILLVAAVWGLALGAFNGVLVWKIGIPPIVTTLGTMTIYRGLTFVMSGGAWVNADQMSPAFIALQRGIVVGLPVLSWIAVFAIIAFWLFFRMTPTGRAIYAVGVNPVAAVYTGIDVGRTQFIAFCISGLVSGVAGYLWVSRYVIASVEVANGYELNVIAACVIGGISIAGGLGSVAGAVLGALFLGLIGLALPVINVSPFWQMAISGMAILVAIVLNARGRQVTGRRILKQSTAA
jgi:rhamnose transport system permease protein